MRSDQIAPHNVDLEQAVIGAAMIRTEIIPDLAAIVSPSDFFIVRHQWIWQAILDLRRNRQPVDYLTITTELENASRLEDVGGVAYLLKIANAIPSALNAEGYARDVHNLSVRRQMVAAAQATGANAHTSGMSVEDALEKSIAELSSVAERHYAVTTTVQSTGDATINLITEAQDRAANPVDVTGITTGISRHDDKLNGYAPGEMHLIAARPGMGKSSVAAQGAYGQAKSGLFVLMFSLEMPREEMLKRMLCQEAMVPYDAISKGYAGRDQLNRYIAAANDLLTWEHRLIIVDTPALTVSTMRGIHRATDRKLRHRGERVECIYVDTIQKVAVPDELRGAGDYTQMTHKSHAIHAWAKGEDESERVAIVVMAQLSRGVESRHDKRPLLSDLRDSGALEEDAYTVTFLYREGYYNPDADMQKRTVNGETRYIDISQTIEVIIAKNRGAETTKYHMWWRGASFAVQAIALETLPTKGDE